MRLWTLAFVVTPIVVVLIGVAAVALHEWDINRKHKNRQPGE